MKTKKKAMIEALKKSMGVVSVAAKSIGIDRTTHYRWLDTDPKYKEIIDNLSEYVVDFVEHALFKKIDGGDTTSMIFYLKTKAKHRGYVERQEIHQSGTLTTEINYLNQRYKESLENDKKKAK